jgi:hypothetical protein
MNEGRRNRQKQTKSKQKEKAKGNKKWKDRQTETKSEKSINGKSRSGLNGAYTEQYCSWSVSVSWRFCLQMAQRTLRLLAQTHNISTYWYASQWSSSWFSRPLWWEVITNSQRCWLFDPWIWNGKPDTRVGIALAGSEPQPRAYKVKVKKPKHWPDLPDIYWSSILGQ